MKAKWRDKVFEVNRVGTEDGYLYDISQVEFIDEKVIDDTLDEVYWINLKHQYAGMAMQGMLSGGWVEMLYKVVSSDGEYIDLLAHKANALATALVEKLKSESNEKKE